MTQLSKTLERVITIEVVGTIETDKTSGDLYTICLLIWVAKHATSHMLQINKNNNYMCYGDRLSVSIHIERACSRAGTRQNQTGFYLLRLGLKIDQQRPFL